MFAPWAATCQAPCCVLMEQTRHICVPVPAGAVEVWLLEVEGAMKRTLHKVCSGAAGWVTLCFSMFLGCLASPVQPDTCITGTAG